MDNGEVDIYRGILDGQAWNRVSYLVGNEMVIFNGYPTNSYCGLMSQNLNQVGQDWTQNCVGYDDMKFEVIDDDCSYVNIFL